MGEAVDAPSKSPDPLSRVGVFPFLPLLRSTKHKHVHSPAITQTTLPTRGIFSKSMPDEKPDRKPDRKGIPGGKGGTIYPGGVPGSTPGPGRPPNELKALIAQVSRQAWEELQKRLTDPDELAKLTPRDLATIAGDGTKYVIPKPVDQGEDGPAVRLEV